MHIASKVMIVLVVVVAVVFPLMISFFFGGQISLYISPPYSFNDIPDLTGKVAIVTGSNTGIGYVSARELARKGAKVILAARSPEKGEEAVRRIKAEIGNVPGAKLVEFMKLDLSDMAQVKTFGEEFDSKRLPLDILILNAGVMSPAFGLTADGLETQIGTNHFGHFLLVKLLIPVIKASKARIVHVSSVAHLNTYPEGIRYESFSSDFEYSPFKAYGQSKLANILFSNELARQLNGTGVTSNALHPGMIKTELGRHIEASAKSSVFLNFLLGIGNVLLGATQLNADGGALTQLYVATSPQMSGITGEYYIPIALKSSTSPYAKNETMQKTLWAESDRLTSAFW